MLNNPDNTCGCIAAEVTDKYADSGFRIDFFQ